LVCGVEGSAIRGGLGSWRGVRLFECSRSSRYWEQSRAASPPPRRIIFKTKQLTAQDEMSFTVFCSVSANGSEHGRQFCPAQNAPGVPPPFRSGNSCNLKSRAK
jgi:hypothetical protein